MNVEDPLAEAMRRTAGTIEPRVTELVTGGITRGRRQRLRRRVRAASAVVAVTAAAVATGVVTVGAGDDAATSRPPAVRLVSATAVLGKAANVADSRPWTEPRPNQWVYRKVVGVDGATGAHPSADESWIRVDWSQDAWFHKGRLVIRHNPDGGRGSQQITKVILSLPPDPQSARTQVYKIIDAEPRSDWEGRTRDSQAFHTIVQWMWSDPVTIPPKLQATLYRALATIPHIAVDGNAKDGLGRPAIAVHQGGFGDQFLLDPATH